MYYDFSTLPVLMCCAEIFTIITTKNEKDESNDYNIMLQPREDDSRMY